VRKILCIIIGLCLCGWLSARAETYPLTDNTSISGDIISFNDDGVVFHTTDDKYTDRVPWTKFSQDALKLLANDTKFNAKEPKIRDYAEPFIEMPPKAQSHAPIVIHSVTRMELPSKQSVIGALFSSSLGFLMILLIYAANIYAGFEIAIFRVRPIPVVMGVAAVLPILGPIIFLSMPTYMPPGATEEDMQMETGAPPSAIAPTPGAPGAPAVAGEAAPGTTESVHLAPAGWQAATPIPETQTFQRGQFTFNRRFLETKFSGFFGMTRHGANKDMILTVKTTRGQHVVERFSRIAANDIHLEVVAGGVHQEIMVPFAEILEIQLKHKDA
jgi:hypothetical protein